MLQDLFEKIAVKMPDVSTPTLLTSFGVTGVFSTAYLASRASFKAARLIDQEQGERDGVGAAPLLTQKEKAKLVWAMYLPAATVGTITIAAVVLANHEASKKIAALTIASSISERAFQEYKEKVLLRVGQNKETAIRDEIAQDRVTAHPVHTREVILAGTGEVLCFDVLTGRYFQSSVQEIRQAEVKVNHDIMNHMYASLSSFYDEIGLAPTPYSDEVGWNVNDLVTVEFSTVLSTDERPCISIDFMVHPKADYTNLY
jgi:hypothetical protein